MVLGRITRGRHTNNPGGRHSIRTNEQYTSINPPPCSHRMPFLLQLSQFILACDRHRNMLDCIPPLLVWISLHQKGKTILDFNETRDDRVAVTSFAPRSRGPSICLSWYLAHTHSHSPGQRWLSHLIVFLHLFLHGETRTCHVIFQHHLTMSSLDITSVSFYPPLTLYNV